MSDLNKILSLINSGELENIELALLLALNKKIRVKSLVKYVSYSLGMSCPWEVSIGKCVLKCEYGAKPFDNFLHIIFFEKNGLGELIKLDSTSWWRYGTTTKLENIKFMLDEFLEYSIENIFNSVTQ